MADNVNWSGWVTPDLARNPGLASDAYKSGNPDTTGAVLAQTAKGVSAADAINDNVDANGNRTFWDRLGTGAINTLAWLGKPLKEVQKDYKFLHAVYTDHGFVPGFTATLGILGAGAAGALAGPLGATVAADIAAAGTRKILGNVFKDSYAKSEDENYKVSPGRDFSNAISKAADAIGADAAAKAFRDTQRGIGKVVSGVGDIGFDIQADPVMVVSRFSQLMKAGKLVDLSKAGELQVKYPILKTVPGVNNFVISRTGAAVTAEQMDLVRQNAGRFFGVGAQYNRALDDIAKSTAGEIVQKYPQLGPEAAGRLGQLKTADEVHNFLKTSLYFGELRDQLAGQAILPSRTILRAKLGDSRVVDYLRNDGSLPGKIYKTFSGYMPFSIDPQTLKLSLTRFRWNSSDAPQVIYRIARFGMGDAAAKEWAGKYAEALAAGSDVGELRAIKNETLMHTFKALGLPDDNQFVKHIMDKVSELEQPPISTQNYGSAVDGKVLGEYVTKNGDRAVAGISSDQAQDLFHIPDFQKIKRAMRDAGQYTKFIGKIDDFVADSYTNTIFKPLALATAGFGLRVAAAEMIPTFARFGIMNAIKAKIAVNAAQTKYELAKGEEDHIAAAALTSLGAGDGIAEDAMTKGFPIAQKAKELKLKFAEKLAPEEWIDLATRATMAQKGHFLPDAVITGHGYDADPSFLNSKGANYLFQTQKNGPLFKDLPEFTTYSPVDNHYVPVLTTNLNKAANNQMHTRVAEDILRYQKQYAKAFKQPGEVVPVSPGVTTGEFYNTPEYLDMRKALVESEYKRMMASVAGDFKPYDAERKTMTRWTNGDLHQFAEDRVDKTLGMLVGKDGTFHQNWAENMAAGKETDARVVAAMHKSAPQSMPAGVSGPVIQEYIPGKNLYSNIIALGFKKVMDPIVNNLAREPLYMLHLGDAYKSLEPQIAKGWVTKDQALRISQSRAVYSMLPQIHNTALRNQFAQIARNFLPFYFAQEQALKRAFNTLKDTSVGSPLFSRGLRFYQLSEHAMSDPSFMTTDENGNKFVNIPLVGEFGKMVQGGLGAFGVPIVTGLPITAKGSTVSLKSVLPELQTPGVSPMMAISGNLLADFFPSQIGRAHV